MPQADLYYTADMQISAPSLLSEIETAISSLDTRAGTTKGRAHRVEDFHHSHVYLVVSMLPKADRDAAYAAKIGQALQETLRGALNKGAAFNINIRFDLEHYL